MGSLLLRWLVNSLALYIVTLVVDGIRYDTLVTLVIAALVLGLLNAVVKPILFWLTLPLTIVTLGIFLIVLNAIMLQITALLVPGFTISTFFAAFIGAIILGILSLITNRIGKDEKK